MLAVLMIISGVFLRLVPHVPNFAPISATALFGGAYLNKRSVLIVPLAAMVISNYLLLYINPFGNPMVDISHIQPITHMFHPTTLYVWGSFTITGLFGIWLKNNKKPSNIVAASLVASLQFFLITNFGVWAGGMYSRGIDGLFQSYIMGLPFFKWTLLGDLFYTGVFFASFEIASKVVKQPILKLF